MRDVEQQLTHYWAEITAELEAPTPTAVPVEPLGGGDVRLLDTRRRPGWVTAADLIAIRNHPHGPSNPAGIENRYDINKDTLVDATDLILARNAVTDPLDLIPLPAV